MQLAWPLEYKICIHVESTLPPMPIQRVGWPMKSCIKKGVTEIHVGRGGSLVELIAVDRRVVGSNPDLVAT